jgi:hypothetical protein
MNGAMTVVCVAGGALLLAASGKIKLSAKRAGLAAAIFLFFALPPFVQRYFWTENPFFPYLTGIFGSNVKDAQYVIGRWGAELAATVGMPATLFNFVLMPYHLIVNPGRFQNFPQYFALSASILLAVRLFSKRKISPVGLGLAAYILAYFIFWFFFGRVWRLMLLPLPFMLLFLCSWPFQENDKFARGAMLLVLCINLIPPVTWGVNNQLFGAFALPSLDEPGKPSRERYLEKALNSYATFAYANEHLDNNAFVLLFSEVRGYYLRKNYMWGDPLNQALIAYQNYASPEELLARLRELGVTHIIINYASYGVDELYYNERTMLLMSGVISRHAKRIYSENSVILYELEGVK